MSRDSASSSHGRTSAAAGTNRSPKQQLIDEVGERFRINGNQENAFDNLAARKLGVNRTDLNCLDIIERLGQVTAGQLAAETGLTTGAVTGVIDRLEQAGHARRLRDDADRRRVLVEGTESFHRAAWEIWGPMKAEWDELMRRHTSADLRILSDFVAESTDVFRRHSERLREELGD